MCGIAGIKGKVEEGESKIKAMLDSMFYRGPDSCCYERDGDFLFGNRRLRIVDLTSNADQPLRSEDGNISLVCNGEIYNFRILQTYLERKGHRFSTKTDIEVIIHGYEEWGQEILNKLQGMFAFAIWDKKEKALFLARDRFGIKPLYYSYVNGIFLFASSVKAILSAGVSTKKINLAALASYLYFGGVSGDLTMFEDVYLLKPATFLKFKKDNLSFGYYWQPSLSKNTSFSLQKVHSDIQQLFDSSIDKHLFSHVPWGIFLSGGLDSACLLNSAAKKVDRIFTISLSFKEKRWDESSFAELLVKKYNTIHYQRLLTSEDMQNFIPKAIAAMDQPTFDGINTYIVSFLAKEAGLKVMLSGLGADELFGGYPSFRRIPHLLRLSRVLDKKPCLRKPSAFLARYLLPSSYKSKILDLCNQDYSIEKLYFLIRALFTKEQINLLLKENSIALPSPIALSESKDLFSYISWLELSYYMHDILLRDTDVMSMANSIEVRVPFLDQEFAEYVLSLPSRYKINVWRNKWLLLQTIGQDLPDKIKNRKKQGFVLPFAKWLKEDLKEEVELEILKKNTIFDEFVNYAVVVDMWNMFLKGRLLWQRPWSIFILKKWLISNAG